MLHQTFLVLGQLWQLFEVSQILEFLRYERSSKEEIENFLKHVLGRKNERKLACYNY